MQSSPQSEEYEYLRRDKGTCGEANLPEKCKSIGELVEGYLWSFKVKPVSSLGQLNVSTELSSSTMYVYISVFLGLAQQV